MNIFKKITIESVLRVFLGAFLFFLPWQTVYIYKDQFLNGVKWEYGTLDFYATEMLFWVCAGLFMVWYWRRVKNFRIKELKNFRLTKDRLFVLSCLCFVVYCFATSFWAIDREVAVQHALRILEAVLLFFIVFLGPLSSRVVALSFVTGAVLPSMLGIWQFLSQSTFDSTLLGLTEHAVDAAGTSVVVGDDIGRWLRAYGTFPHPNMFGGYLVFTVAVGLWLLKDEENERIRLAMHAMLLIETAALFFTLSRSAWIAALLVLLSYCYIAVFHKQKQLNVSIASLLVCACILTVCFSPLIRVRTEAVSANEVLSIAERVGGYHEAFALWKEHPWKGAGVGNYTAAVFAKDPTRFGWEYQPVHNVPLLLLVELGLFGIVLIVGVVVSFFMYHVTRNTKQIQDRHCEVECSIAVCNMLRVTCYMLPLALLDHYLFSSHSGLFSMAIAAAIGSRFLPQFLHNSSPDVSDFS